MRLLTCPNQGGHSYWLTREKDHYVGRISGDIILAADQSVSRSHAVFKFISNSENDEISSVTVTDLKSKYGTYINGSKKLVPNEPYLLQNGDVVKFGCQWNEWSYFSKPLVVATSTVPLELKTSIKNVVTELGGILVNDWQDNCSHLTMTNILLTAKVVCALASAVPIVTPEYWTSLKEALAQKKLPPVHDKFIPPLKENVLNKNKVSFAVNENRKTIFSGKTFVFSTEKQMKKFKCVISAAGGKVVSLANSGWRGEDFCKPNIILMQQIQSDTQPADSVQQYNSVLKLIKSKGGKPIPEQEIGLAVLMCSLNIYCNPHYNVVQNVLNRGSTLNESQLQNEEILAADTPSAVSDITSIKMEMTADEQSLAGNELSIPASISSLESGSHSKGSSEGETLPVDVLRKVNVIPSVAPAVEPDKPENVPSRKRTAPDDLLEPAPKKLSSEKISSTNNLPMDSSLFVPFDFVDLLPPSSSLHKKNSNDLRNISTADSAKRKHEDANTNIPNGQHSKNQRQETPWCSKQVLQSGIELFKNMEKITDKESQLAKRAKLDSCSYKDLGSKSHPEQGNSSPSSTSVSRCDEFASTSKTSLSERTNRQDTATPSTSKGESRAMISSADDKMSSNKWGAKLKVGGRRILGINEICINMVVKMEDLIIERPRLPMNNPSVSHYSVNFKKFKKVRSQGTQNGLPQVLGEGDLMLYKESGMPKE